MDFNHQVLALMVGLFLGAHGQDPSCFDRGECTGSLIVDTWPAEDTQECFERAQTAEGAEFFTFYDETGDCTAFANCEVFDTQSCVQCYSGSTNDCPDLECWRPGVCDGGNEISSFSEDSGEDCRTTCQDTPDCLWFTYDAAAQMCYHYDGECIGFLDQEDAYTSQNACYRQLKTLRRTKVVLVAGSISDGQGDNDYSTVVELFDIDSNTDCFLDNYPHTADGPTCTFLKEGNIKCCGGEGPEDMNQCYDYETSSNNWSRAPDLSDSRYWPRSSHVEEGFWMVTGGHDCGDEDCTTSDLWIGTQFIAGPTLQGADLSSHCQVGLGPMHVFIAEGETGRAWILDWETQEFIEQDTMASPKELPGCGRIVNADGEIEVVVASLGQSEIFNFSSGTWRQGPDVPVYGYRFGYDQLGDTFVLAGGDDDSGPELAFLEEVLVFDPMHYQWIVKPHVLNPARYGAGVAAVPEEFFTVSCP